MGDGRSSELSGALDSGMTPVRILVSYEEISRDFEAQEWDGPTISTLAEVLKLVGY